MTCSDHPPFVYPKDIPLQPRNGDMEKKIVEYADWAIGRFIRAASQQPWFANTLFVFVADHGHTGENEPYAMSLDYHHIPLAFYAPGRIAPQRDHRLALQMDLAPTLLSMLGVPVPVNLFGVNLLQMRRPYAFFSADDRLGVLDGEYFMQYRPSEEQTFLNRYREAGPVNYAADDPDRVARMKRYAFSMIQMSQQLLLDNATSCQ